MSEDRILLQGLAFRARHGALASERETDQEFVVSLDLACDLRPAALADDLAKTVDYSQVYRLAREIVEGPPVHLLETLAERIASALLRRYPQVRRVRVRVGKPRARVADDATASAAVEIVRERSG